MQYNWERTWRAIHELRDNGIVSLLLLGQTEHQRAVSNVWFNVNPRKMVVLVYHPDQEHPTELPFDNADYVFLIEGESRFWRNLWMVFFCLRYPLLLLERRK